MLWGGGGLGCRATSRKMCPRLPSAKALGQRRLQDGAVDVSEDLLSSRGEGAAPPIPCSAENPRRARGRASQPRAGMGALTGRGPGRPRRAGRWRPTSLVRGALSLCGRSRDGRREVLTGARRCRGCSSASGLVAAEVVGRGAVVTCGPAAVHSVSLGQVTGLRAERDSNVPAVGTLLGFRRGTRGPACVGWTQGGGTS